MYLAVREWPGDEEASFHGEENGRQQRIHVAEGPAE
jgi:hypothetical protein